MIDAPLADAVGLQRQLLLAVELADLLLEEGARILDEVDVEQHRLDVLAVARDRFDVHRGGAQADRHLLRRRVGQLVVELQRRAAAPDFGIGGHRVEPAFVETEKAIGVVAQP